MPFAFYAFRRYFDTGRRRALAGAAAAVIAENLSCGYYLLYFSPFVAAYVLWEIWRSEFCAGPRPPRAPSAGGVGVRAATRPSVFLYLWWSAEVAVSRAPAAGSSPSSAGSLLF